MGYSFAPHPFSSGETVSVIQCRLDESSGVKRRDFGVALINTAQRRPLSPYIHAQHLDANYNLSCH